MLFMTVVPQAIFIFKFGLQDRDGRAWREDSDPPGPPGLDGRLGPGHRAGLLEVILLPEAHAVDSAALLLRGPTQGRVLCAPDIEEIQLRRP
eukprot:2413577-Pyramimonas_sp.AAC.1